MKGALHHHLVITGIDPKIFSKHWPKGRPVFTILDSSGEYSQLATYWLKNKKYWKKHGGKGKQYSSSRNLVRPVTKKKVVRAKNGYYEKPRPKKGYYIKPGSEEFYTHENGYPSMRYILVEHEQERRAP